MDKVVPGSSVSRGDIPVHRVPTGCDYGVEINPDELRDTNGFDMDGVNMNGKAPRTDPSTYDYQVKRPG